MSLVDQANLILAMVLFVAGKHIACKVSTPPFSSVCYAVHPHPPCCVPTMNLLGMVHSYSRMLAPCALLVSSPAPGSSTSLSTLPVNLLVSHHSTWTLELLTQWPLLLLLPCLLAHFAVSQYTLKCDLKALVSS